MELLLWLYVLNAGLLITHEIDSAYWREWELFRLPGGVNLFLLLHLPLTCLVLWGVILLVKGSRLGLVFSLILAGSGLAAFFIHMFFIKKGRPEFRTPVSLTILTATLVVSSVQMVLSLLTLTLG